MIYYRTETETEGKAYMLFILLIIYDEDCCDQYGAKPHRQ